jgi:hypothetical protein
MDPVKNILGEQQVKCFTCGKKMSTSEAYYYYAGDQDNLVCKECAKKLTHTETAYRGMNVFETGEWGR